MTQVKKGIKIIQYHEGWAKGVAKMWNLSREGWGGDTRVMTEDQVKKKEANSDNIVLYLAVDGDEVVGYCGLSEYKEDTGSLYIPLLNVRPDYQGKKIGKMLVLTAIEKTIDLGWPRLDLYTWPGNTKAVPLYKKCGFFWEDRDDSTHLMNFIPQVLNTPLLKPIFSELDWYHSSERIIEVKPDGVNKNGFTYYEYNWRNENLYARVQFERTGRGISFIETNDFVLEIMLDDHEVTEQEKQQFHIRFINKTSSPMLFKATGTGNERMEYSIDAELIVENEAVLSETLYVNAGEEPSIWRTHPFLSVSVSINGEKCELRLGVFPVQPAKVEASYSGNLSFLDKETSVELVVKNNLKEEALYTILFPENEQVSLINRLFTEKIPAKGRKLITVPLIVRKNGFYQPTLMIKVKKNDGTEIEFKHPISIAFKGLGEKFGGESKDYWHIYNGLGQVNIRKRDLQMTAAKNSLKKQSLAFFPPKLGKPYSNEFTKKKPNFVSLKVNDYSILMQMELQSGEMEGIYLTQNIQLFGDGIVHKWIEVENQGTQNYEQVAISMPHFHELGETYFPLDNQVVHFSEKRMLEFGDLDPARISGNWYFSENKPEPIGISWSNNSKAFIEGWQFVIENELDSLAPGEKKETEKVVLSIGTFNKWEDFRAFAKEDVFVEKSEVSDEYLFTTDKLITGSDITVSLKTFRNSYLNGDLQVYLNGEEIHDTTISTNEETLNYSYCLPLMQTNPISIMEGIFKENSLTTHFEELVLYPTRQFVSSHLVTLDHIETFEVNNGSISIQSAPEYYPGIYSLKVNGLEWLESSFPNITAKSWWNPWAGGMKTAPSGLNTFSLKKEKHDAYFVEKWDLQGNKWSGLAIQTEIVEHSDWKGVQYIQYYLLLPGVPVLVTYLEVLNNGGKNLKEESWVTDLFVGGEDLSNLSVQVKGSHKTTDYKTGVQELPINFDLDCCITSITKTEKLYFIPSLYSEYTEVYTNREAFQMLTSQSVIPNETSFKTAPLFMIFDQRILSEELLLKIRRIQF